MHPIWQDVCADLSHYHDRVPEELQVNKNLVNAYGCGIGGSGGVIWLCY